MDPAKSRREVPRDTAWARALASHPVDAATVLRGTLGGLPKYARSQAHRSRSLANRRPGRSARGGVSLGVYGCVAIAMTGKTAGTFSVFATQAAGTAGPISGVSAGTAYSGGVINWTIPGSTAASIDVS